MKRRGFLQFLGLAPAAPFAPKIAEAAKMIEAVEEPVPIMSSTPADSEAYTDVCCTISCDISYPIGDLQYVRFSRRK